jgi:KipI family sensor histidine kinase inhibitor
VRVLPFGEDALLAECDDLDEVLSLHRALAATPARGVVELVPAARTVLVRLDLRVTSLGMIEQWLVATGTHPDAVPSAPDRVVTVLVDYDGDDLDPLAAELGVSPDALVAAHGAATWRAAFTGFAPGFAYLVADDWPFDVPRLATSRERVPAGSVGLAGAFSGVYPRESPGGWRLIGTTDAVLWDLDARPPALLTPGTRVVFEPR